MTLTAKFGEANKRRSFLEQKSGRLIKSDQIEQLYVDVAASAQKKLEDICLHLVRLIVEQTGQRQLVLAGGVGLNCSMNGALARSGLIDDLFIQPAANDAGAPIGAALELYAHLGYDSKWTMQHAYLGPSYTDEQVQQVLREVGVPYTQIEDPASVAAELLAEGKVVGWFQGRCEFGPRALGNRSILAHPGMPGVRDHLNANVKHREKFRPFALSMESARSQRVLPHGITNPFMLLSQPVQHEMLDKVREGVHVDDTTRPQVFARQSNPTFAAVLDQFEQATGIPAVINTSFNDEGEPIVRSPYDALRTFWSSPIDDLVIGRYWLSKHRSNLGS
jgi:carbamoyltransferase